MTTLLHLNTAHLDSKPLLPELLKLTCTDGRVFRVHEEIATDYFQFGIFLLDDKSGARVKSIAREHHYHAEQINMEILQEWLSGRGKLPVTWATLVEVLGGIKQFTLAEAIKYRG